MSRSLRIPAVPPADNRGDRETGIRRCWRRLQSFFVKCVYIFAKSDAVLRGYIFFPPNPKYMALHFRDLRPPCNPSLQQGISLGEVRRAEPAFWFYEVTEKQFRRALRLSLQEAGLLASGQGRYTLSAHLLHMAVPLAGRDTKILASVLYTMTGYDEPWGVVIKSSGEVTFGQAFFAEYA